MTADLKYTDIDTDMKPELFFHHADARLFGITEPFDRAKLAQLYPGGRAEYLKWAERLPGLLRFVPNAGRLRDAKNYLLLISYFLQPTPTNIRSMILLLTILLKIRFTEFSDPIKVISRAFELLISG